MHGVTAAVVLGPASPWPSPHVVRGCLPHSSPAWRTRELMQWQASHSITIRSAAGARRHETRSREPEHRPNRAITR